MNYFYLLLHYQIRFDHKFTTCRKGEKNYLDDIPMQAFFFLLELDMIIPMR